ncbi:MAG: ferritin family protein [Chloroflexota bacterium]
MVIELVNEHKIGSALGTVVEQAAEANFMGETQEVGLYLAMARQAMREGYPEIAEAIKTVAWEEAWHAAGYAEMVGKISTSTKKNLETMLRGEQGANRGKREAAVKAKEAGLDLPHDFFDESSRDEARHANILAGLLSRYFPDRGGH